MPLPAADPSRLAGSALWRRPAVRQLLLVSMLGFSSFFMTLASLPLWTVQGGASTSAAGLVTTVMLATTVVTQTAVPWLLNRLGTGLTFSAGLVALGAPAPLLALSTQLEPLLVISAVRGAGFAVLTVVGASLIATVAPAGRHGEAVGLYGLAVAVPNMIGVPAGVALTQRGAFGWVGLLAALPLLAVPVALSLSRECPLSGRGPVVAGSHRTAVTAVLAPSLVLLAVTLAGGGLLTFLPIARPSGALAAIALLAFGLVAAVCRWGVGLLADRVGTGLLLPGCLVVAVLGMAVLAGALYRGWDAAVLVGVVVFGAGYGAVQNLTLVVAFSRAGPGRITTASTAWNASFDLGTAVGAGLIGVVAATGVGFHGAYVVAAFLMAATMPLAISRRARRRHAPA